MGLVCRLGLVFRGIVAGIRVATGANVNKFSDAARARTEPVSEELGRVDLTPDGGEFVGIKSAEPISDWTDVFARFNLDPDVFEVVDDTVRMSMWQQSKRTDSGDRDVVNLYSYSARFTRKREQLDLPLLYSVAKRPRNPRRPENPQPRATVVVFADPQIGKTGSRGGTPELIDRLAGTRAKLRALLQQRQPEQILFADAGDGFEGFESGGNPMFTNDLSLAQQMDVYGTELWLFIELMHRFAPVTVAGVPSNHTAWRNAKQNLGNPQDDLGLLVHRQVEKITTAAKMNVDYRKPADYDECVTVDLYGTILGLAHGNQFGPGQGVSWWEKQTFGAQAIAHCDLLVTGHYHSFGASVAGRNPHTGRQRYWLSAPTLDNGSDWYRTSNGRDSDPGMLVFDVTADGFDLSSLTIL